ncbi:MAG: aspartate dehydrogenase [Lachnospiraceae bacterium]|nr:aspartate dehydrogenase [Lachnospiraceae bacterium]
MFGKRKNKKVVYDKTGKIPVIRASICTGEKVAGFKDAATGKFEDLMVIRTEADLKGFLEQYDVREEEIRKEW